MTDDQSLYIFVAEGSEKTWAIKNAGPLKRHFNNAGKTVRDMGRGLREFVSPIRWTSEKMFSGYGEQMEALREIDNQIQEWTRDLDNALDRAKEAKKVGRPLDVIFWLSQINTRLKLVSDKKQEISDIQDKDMDSFFEDTEHGVLDDYFHHEEGRLVQAGIADSAQRKITNWKVQKMYRKRVEEQKRALVALINLASSTVNRVEHYLSGMSKARADGDIAAYIQLITKISEQQTKFQTQFKSIYDRNFASMVERIKEREKQNKLQQESENMPVETISENHENVSPELEKSNHSDTIVDPLPTEEFVSPASTPLLTPPTVPDDVRRKMLQQLPPDPVPEEIRNKLLDFEEPISSKILDVSSPEGSIYVEEPEEDEEKIDRDTQVDLVTASVLQARNKEFYKQLIKASALNNPYLLANMLIRYSEQIENICPKQSQELLTMAAGILHE